MTRRLYRSETDRMLTGVAGGMAEYFNFDPVLARLLWVLAAVFSGGLVIVVYFIMAIVTPTAPSAAAPPGAPPPAQTPAPGTAEAPTAPPPDELPTDAESKAAAAAHMAGPSGLAAPVPPVPPRAGTSAVVVIGVALLIIGGIALLDSLTPYGFFDFWRLWPLILIALGAAIIYARRSK